MYKGIPWPQEVWLYDTLFRINKNPVFRPGQWADEGWLEEWGPTPEHVWVPSYWMIQYVSNPPACSLPGCTFGLFGNIEWYEETEVTPELIKFKLTTLETAIPGWIERHKIRDHPDAPADQSFLEPVVDPLSPASSSS